MRASRKARAWVVTSPAVTIAEAEAPHFPTSTGLTANIATYQTLGCWTPHVEITRPALDVAIDVFVHAGQITRRARLEDVVAPPPDD